MPAPRRLQLDKARRALFEAASGPFHSDPDCDGPDLWMDDDLVADAVESFILRLGLDRLTSDAFWAHFATAREAKLGIKEALDQAAEKTPPL